MKYKKLKKVLNLRVAILLSALMFVSSCASIQGVVRDKPSGTPIPSAIVSVGKKRTSTDNLGYYNLSGNFKKGKTLMVNASGYNIYTYSIKEKNEIIDIDLTPKNSRMDKIINSYY